jgi:phosphocarrier protein
MNHCSTASRIRIEGAPMPSKSVVVGSSVGLHARPAALIAQAAGGLEAGVTINGMDASSALMLMTLGAKCGDTVEVASDDETALETIATMVAQDLDA